MGGSGSSFQRMKKDSGNYIPYVFLHDPQAVSR